MAHAEKNLSATQETRVPSLGWEDPLEKEMASTLVFLPGEFHGQKSLLGYSPWDQKKSDTAERLTLFFFTFKSFTYWDDLLHINR